MSAVLEQARQIAALDETPPVLITGETGTGKGLVARTIHAGQPAPAKPFIEVNCTALPATLMEAELFGYERGPSPTPRNRKIGLFEAAEGGFLFLDEVGDIELSLQGKLLKAIEERTVRRVGGIRDRKIDVRILAATNRDLEREAQRDRFRRDLYFRLAVILLRLPPLRERGDDVLLLAEHFLRRFSAKYGKPVRADRPAGARAPAALSLARQRARAEPRHRAGRALEPGADARHRAPVARARRADAATPGRGTATARGAGRSRPAGMDLEQWERSLIEQALRESRRQPDPGGSAAGNLPGHASVPAQEVRIQGC